MAALLHALRLSASRSVALRHLRNRFRFPGLWLDPSVNHAIFGDFEYGSGISIAEGCNLLVPTGASLRLGDKCYVGRHVELSPLGRIDIGDRTSIQDRCILVGDVRLGRYCILSLNVLMTSGTHYFERAPHLLIKDQDKLVGDDPKLSLDHSRPIFIGEDCWLGMNSVVMPGVSVGRGCVIGSNAVVSKNVPPYSVAAGVPAQVIKQRLQFVPPPRIDWRDPQDFPYFYSGFQLSQEELVRNAPLGGHVASRAFTIWLGGLSDEIRVRIRSIGDSEVIIKCHGHTESIAADWTDCRFRRRDAGAALNIEVQGGAIVVSEAWVP
jgi:acetyltransferase-like isoleucine patch superfamily enzyme